ADRYRSVRAAQGVVGLEDLAAGSAIRLLGGSRQRGDVRDLLLAARLAPRAADIDDQACDGHEGGQADCEEDEGLAGTPLSRSAPDTRQHESNALDHWRISCSDLEPKFTGPNELATGVTNNIVEATVTRTK